MTTVVIMGDYMTLGHVGDSRAYLITGDQTMEQISLDQTLAQRLVDLGQLTPEEGKLYPRKNILYSALGQSDTLDTLIITRKTPETGYIFICSDGVTSCIDDDTIRAVIRNEKTPQSACDKLVGLANEAGGPDNISAILVKLVA
jgi:protein phosphatase